MRKRARKDLNQSGIEKALRKAGCSVQDTSTIGNGFTDMVVGYRNKNFLFEVKNPDQPLSKRRLTPDEKKFHETWTGQIAVIETSEEALKIIGAIE